MLISFIIPVYGQWHLTKICLQTLKAHTPFPVEVILIDNGYNALKDDKTREEAFLLGKALFGDNFVYLPQEKNINFAGACNLGAHKAKSSLLFFLNNDTSILENYLPPLLESLNQDKNQVLAPILLYPAQEGKECTVQHLGVFFNPINKVGHLYEHFPASHRVVKRKRVLQCVTGAAFLMTKKLFFEAGAFNIEFRNGFEDVELCGKLLALNTEFLVIPSSRILHLCSQSQGRHDATMHNSHVLRKSNVFQLFKPDLHLLLENDGYELRLNPWLQFIPHLNPQLEASFKPLLEKGDKEKIAEQFAKEPFWYAGLDFLLKSSTSDQCLSLLQNAIQINNQLPLYLELLKYGLNKENALSFSQIFQTYLNIEERYAHRLEQLHEMLSFLKKCNETLYLDCKHLIATHNEFMETTFKSTLGQIQIFKKQFAL